MEQSKVIDKIESAYNSAYWASGTVDAMERIEGWSDARRARVYHHVRVAMESLKRALREAKR